MDKKSFPYVTVTIIFLCMIVYVFNLFANTQIDMSILGMYKGAIQNMGIYRIFSHAFVHDGPVHLFSNMLALYVFGNLLETDIGSKNFSIVYLCGIVGGALFINFFGGPYELHVGASGAIWALMIANIAYELRQGELYLDFIICLILNLIATFALANLSWQGHIGGGLFGLIAICAMLKYDKKHVDQNQALRKEQIGDVHVVKYNLTIKL